jgi:hypothetical protein
MAYLSEHCDFSPLTEELVSSLGGFSCAEEPEIATFFREEAVLNDEQRLSKSYCFYRKDLKKIVCAFCVSNSNISTRTMPEGIKDEFVAEIPDEKRRSFYPATLIGQLVVFDDFRSEHVGDEFMDLLKVWVVTKASQIGFRYLVVDAVNKPKVIQYYRNNGFEMLFEDEKTEKGYRNIQSRNSLKTRFMTYDLTLMSIPTQNSTAS